MSRFRNSMSVGPTLAAFFAVVIGLDSAHYLNGELSLVSLEFVANVESPGRRNY